MVIFCCQPVQNYKISCMYILLKKIIKKSYRLIIAYYLQFKPRFGKYSFFLKFSKNFFGPFYVCRLFIVHEYGHTDIKLTSNTHPLKSSAWVNLKVAPFVLSFLFFITLFYVGIREKKRQDNNLFIHKVTFCDLWLIIRRTFQSNINFIKLKLVT